MSDVSAQAFREAADRESQRAVLSRGNGWQASFHGTPLFVIQDANADLLLAAAEQREQWDTARVPCVWTEDMDGLWESKCTDHGPFQFFEGGPDDNHVAFCPYCGHPISAVSYSETMDQEGDDANAD